MLSARKQFCLSLRVCGTSVRSLLLEKLALPKEHSRAVAVGRAGSRLGHLVATAPMEKPSAKSVVRAPQGSSVIKAEGRELVQTLRGSFSLHSGACMQAFVKYVSNKAGSGCRDLS